MISESYKYRLQELAGILLEDNKFKLTKFGFTEQVAKVFTDIDDKLSMFFANIITKEYAKQQNIDKPNLKEVIPLIDQNELVSFIDRNNVPIAVILEWLKSPLRQGDVNLQQIKDLSQALEMAQEWHNNIEASGIIKDQSGEIIKEYPDGFYWIDLQTNSSADEGQAMGHCGTDRRATTLFSLRDKSMSPHVTVAYNTDKKIVTQVKGRSNKRPIDKYMEYVFDFLKELSDTDRLDNFEWSYGVDLTREDIRKIFGPKKFFFYIKGRAGEDVSNLYIRR